MTMKINEIWQELENDESFSHGLLLRRCSTSVLPDLFVAMRSPEKTRGIGASVGADVPVNLSPFSNLRDISVERIEGEPSHGKSILLFQLLNNVHQDIFTVLCEDLIASVASVSDESKLINELLNRFEKWKSLFDKAGLQGLTPEEQRGLFGELFFTRKYTQNGSSALNTVNSWVGPARQLRDFQSGSWALEVKTTHGNNHQKIQISSERQLDRSNLDNLFLYHLSLDARQQSGETLNQLADNVSEIVSPDFTALNRFKNKLLEVGYFEHHRPLYESNGYFVRQESIYEVEGDFPRIEEGDIRNGVGDVKYSIITANCSDFVRTEEQLFQILQ